MQRILGESPCIPPPPKPAVLYPKTEFTLPPKHADNRRVFAYLRSRGIDAEIINHCIKHGQLYEDAVRHNCIFVGFAEGKPAYAMLRGTQREKRFVGEAAGSDKRFTFAVPLAPSNGSTLCVFEGAIDALSYLTLLKQQGSDWRKANTLALGGISGKGLQRLPPALTQYLKAALHISRIVLCLDNDEPGRVAAAALQELLAGYEVIDKPPLRGKDYNDLLRYRHCARHGAVR